MYILFQGKLSVNSTNSRHMKEKSPDTTYTKTFASETGKSNARQKEHYRIEGAFIMY